MRRPTEPPLSFSASLRLTCTMPAGSLLSAAHCHGFRRIRTNENSAVYMRARRDRASICPCMAQTSRANYYNSIESPLYYYGFVTNPHLAHHFIHIIPMLNVHKLSVNRLCRQGSKKRFVSDFFRRLFFHFPVFIETHISPEWHKNTFPHYSQLPLWTIFHIFIVRRELFSEDSFYAYSAVIL